MRAPDVPLAIAKGEAYLSGRWLTAPRQGMKIIAILASYRGSDLLVTALLTTARNPVEHVVTPAMRSIPPNRIIRNVMSASSRRVPSRTSGNHPTRQGPAPRATVILRRSVARRPTLPVTPPVQKRDDRDEQPNHDQDPEAVYHSRSPISQTAIDARPIQTAPPARMTIQTTRCCQTNWLNTRAAAAKFARSRIFSPSTARCLTVNRSDRRSCADGEAMVVPI